MRQSAADNEIAAADTALGDRSWAPGRASCFAMKPNYLTTAAVAVSNAPGTAAAQGSWSWAPGGAMKSMELAVTYIQAQVAVQYPSVNRWMPSKSGT
jgi:hypothetical protein